MAPFTSRRAVKVEAIKPRAISGHRVSLAQHTVKHQVEVPSPCDSGLPDTNEKYPNWTNTKMPSSPVLRYGIWLVWLFADAGTRVRAATLAAAYRLYIYPGPATSLLDQGWLDPDPLLTTNPPR